MRQADVRPDQVDQQQPACMKRELHASRRQFSQVRRHRPDRKFWIRPGVASPESARRADHGSVLFPKETNGRTEISRRKVTNCAFGVSTGLIPRAAFMVSHESRATGLGMTGSRTRRLYTHSARLVETGTGARSFMACGGRVGRSMVWHVHKHKFPQFCAAWPGGRSVETFFSRLHVHRSVRLVESNVDTRIESGGISKPCISEIRSIPFSMRPSGHSSAMC